MDVETTLIVGGGVIGLTAAIALRERGRRVIVFDPGPIPHPLAASTDISKAVRADYGGDTHYAAMMDEAYEGWRRWNAAWETPLYHEDGFAVLSRTPMAPGDFAHESHAMLRARGYALDRLDTEAIAARFPQWRRGAYVDGYFNPVGGWVESGQVVASLADRAVAVGVDIRSGVRVTGFVERSGRVTGVRTADGETIPGGRTVVATGTWAGTLIPELADRIRSIGQPVFHLAPADPAPWRSPHFTTWAADIATTGWYGFPILDDGRLKIANHGRGVDLEPEGPRNVTSEHARHLRAFLRHALPEIADAPIVGTRLCLYADTFDGDFFIDEHPERPGLVVATGGSGHAFKFAPILGDVVADVAEQSDNRWRERFRWRALGPRRTEAARHDGDFTD